MRNSMTVLAVFSFFTICFFPTYASAEAASASKICHKDFSTFFKAYSELTREQQFEYVLFPFTVTSNDGDVLDYQTTTKEFTKDEYLKEVGTGKIVVSQKELRDSGNNNYYYHIYISNASQKYTADLCIEESSCLLSYVFKPRDNCWELIKLEIQNLGL